MNTLIKHLIANGLSKKEASKTYKDIKEATKIICGSARSMGIEVKE